MTTINATAKGSKRSGDERMASALFWHDSNYFGWKTGETLAQTAEHIARHDRLMRGGSKAEWPYTNR